MPSALAPSEARTEGLEASNGSDLHILPQLLHQSYEPCTFDYNLPARFRSAGVIDEPGSQSCWLTT